MNYEDIVKLHQELDAIEAAKPKQFKEPRIYYDSNGEVTMYCEVDHPAEGNYIVIDNPDIFFKNNSILMRVIDNELHIMDPRIPQRSRIIKSTKGQPVVAGHAALALAPGEQVTNIEHYDRKTSNLRIYRSSINRIIIITYHSFSHPCDE